MNKLIYKGNLNDFKTFAGVGITKGNWNERALKYFQYLGATSNSFNTAQKEIEEANLETLRLDFINQDYAVGSADTGAVETKDTFDNILTFSRGSTGTYFDSAGVLQTAAVDEPRFTHNPDTLEAEGLLLEGQRTNLLLQSEAFDNAVWNKARVTVVADAATAPDGTLTADKIVTDGTADPIVNRVTNVGGVAGKSFTFSIWLWTDSSEPKSSQLFLYGSESLEEIVSTPTTLTTTPTRYELSINFSSGAVSSSVITRFDLEQNPTAGDYLYAWGAQLEEGSFPTSYIKTEGSQVTRSADNCSRTLGDEYNSSEGRVEAIATNHTGEFILNLGTQSTLADVDTEKTYTLTYSSDPSAATLDLLSSGAGTIKSVKYYPREAV